MIFELLLFPVKTFQLLRGRKKKALCKQSLLRAVNGLHLSIQGKSNLFAMCASVRQFQRLHLFRHHNKARGAIVRCEPPSATHISVFSSADVRLPAESGAGSRQSAVAPGRLPAERSYPAEDFR